MEFTFKSTDQLLPTLEETIQFFSQESLSATYAQTWFSKMESANWRDAKGNKIMNWRKYARYKITDLKSAKPSEIQFNPIEPKVSAKASGLAPNLLELSIGILQLYEGKTGQHLDSNHQVIIQLINSFQQKLKISAAETETRILEQLKQIVNQKGFSYQYLLSDLNKSISNYNDQI